MFPRSSALHFPGQNSTYCLAPHRGSDEKPRYSDRVSDQVVFVNHFWQTETFNLSFSAFSDGRFTNLYIHYGTQLFSGLLRQVMYQRCPNAPGACSGKTCCTAAFTIAFQGRSRPALFRNLIQLEKLSMRNDSSRFDIMGYFPGVPLFGASVTLKLAE